jgi:hypothetical protein
MMDRAHPAQTQRLPGMRLTRQTQRSQEVSLNIPAPRLTVFRILRNHCRALNAKKVIALFNTMGAPGLLPHDENFYSSPTLAWLTTRPARPRMDMSLFL